MDSNKGKWALVTGGDSGIGLALSRELAGRSYNLLLVSRTVSKLESAAGQLSLEFPEIQVEYKAVDLSVAGAAEEVHEWAGPKDIDVLVNDAGMFLFRDVCNTPVEYLDAMLTLHVRTVTVMCRLFGKDMAVRGCGHILNLSSYSLYMPWPGITVYGATKAYIRHFSISLAKELRESGVHVCAVAPGWIDTDLMGLSDGIRGLGRKVGILMSPAALAGRSLRALFKGRKYIIPGWYNVMFIPFVKHLGPGATKLLRNKTKRYQQ
ncbi:MAG: SDR family NAD(P)-dependent oxidoreductase [Bacteroidales bacterium]|nr:SDR family NAD(P)-dependent oxidoreductase [Bacteroidales bacterium]